MRTVGETQIEEEIKTPMIVALRNYLNHDTSSLKLIPCDLRVYNHQIEWPSVAVLAKTAKAIFDLGPQYEIPCFGRTRGHVNAHGCIIILIIVIRVKRNASVYQCWARHFARLLNPSLVSLIPRIILSFPRLHKESIRRQRPATCNPASIQFHSLV